jgi:UDP-2-acetamido-3-amino-2,3-dideoxy-glucuronate N-acetyltransferase
MSRKIQVAVIGCGYWGKNHIRNFFQLGYLAGICDANPETIKKIKSEYDVTDYSWQEILVHKDIHAVVLATPSSLHCEMVLQALQHGKHVFVEKPMTLSVVEARRIEAYAQKVNRVVMVGHILRYHPAFNQMKALISANKLGTIQSIYSCRFNKLTHDPRIKNLNVIWEFAPHDLSLLTGLMGRDGLSLRVAQQLNLGIKHMAFTYASGCSVEIDVSWHYPHKEQKFIISGSLGLLVFDDCQSWDKKLQLYPHQPNWTQKDPLPDLQAVEYLPIKTNEPLRDECTHFVECIIHNRQPFTDVHEGVLIVSLLDQVLCELAKKKEPQQL